MKRVALPGAYDWAVVDDRERGIFRVNRRVFVDHDVFECERRRVFERCWLYAAHESEVAANGAFVSRMVGGLPLLINRDRLGALHAFFNTCPAPRRPGVPRAEGQGAQLHLPLSRLGVQRRGPNH